MIDPDSVLIIFPPIELELKRAIIQHFPVEIFHDVAVDLVMCYLKHHDKFDRFMAEVDLTAWNYYGSLIEAEQNTIDYIWRNEQWRAKTSDLLERFYHEYSEELRAIFNNRDFELVDFVDDFSANGLSARVKIL